MILVTGGWGFIGSNFIRQHVEEYVEPVINIDAGLTGSNKDNLAGIDDDMCITVNADVNNKTVLAKILSDIEPRAIVHFAAESHVDRSISGPEAFIHSNINGTANMLAMSLEYYKFLKSREEHPDFIFVHVSTDEVYGSLRLGQDKFTEETAYDPRSPYSASKAASDHLVSAYYHTYGFPAIITNCSNNYGPRQHREKFIPTVINSLLQNKKVPVYGNGQNVRDWIHVDDHNHAIHKVLDIGIPGQKYNIGANREFANITLVAQIAKIMGYEDPEEVIEYVTDRPGHDFRYAINNSKIVRELNWSPEINIWDGLDQTIEWYKNENTRNNTSGGK